MSSHAYRTYMATFLTSLSVFIVLGYIYLAFHETANGVKVIEPLASKFEVLNKTVKPGHPLFYDIHYRKYLDIPGDLTKQLIITPKSGGKTVYMPLNDVSGHLPVGEIAGTALVRIPEDAPEGTGRIKLTATYHYGSNLPRPVVVFTEDFEIVK